MVAQSLGLRACDKTHNCLCDVWKNHSGKLEWFSRLVILRSIQIGLIENNKAQQIFISRKLVPCLLNRRVLHVTHAHMYAPGEVVPVELLWSVAWKNNLKCCVDEPSNGTQETTLAHLCLAGMMITCETKVTSSVCGWIKSYALT